MYTDGLIEGWADREGGERLGVDGLSAMVTSRDPSAPASQLPAWLVSQAQELNGGPLADDVAVLLVTPGTHR
jgi:serine phosphatase RsbU (regulator of sigma subunit)